MRKIELPLHEHETRSDLNADLSNAAESLLLGIDAQSARRFYSVNISQSFRLGILSSDLGPKPSIFIADDLQIAFVGHDCTVSIIDISKAIEKTSRKLDGAFFEFLIMPDNLQCIIVIYELGVQCLDVNGRVVWNITTDVIENYKLENGFLWLQIMDEPKPLTIHTESGTIKNN